MGIQSLSGIGGMHLPHERWRKTVSTFPPGCEKQSGTVGERTFGELFLIAEDARDTPQTRVPKQARDSPLDACYDVSQKLSRPADLRWIRWAVSFSVKAIAAALRAPPDTADCGFRG